MFINWASAEYLAIMQTWRAKAKFTTAHKSV